LLGKDTLSSDDRREDCVVEIVDCRVKVIGKVTLAVEVAALVVHNARSFLAFSQALPNGS
jgi:hypothetical protein